MRFMNIVAEKLMRDYLNQYNIDRKQLYLIYSIGLDESIKRRMDEITKEIGFENVTWMQAGAMISTHAGPGGFGIAVFSEKKGNIDWELIHGHGKEVYEKAWDLVMGGVEPKDDSEKKNHGPRGVERTQAFDRNGYAV